MSDLQMDCMGSVIIYKDDDVYCQQCPLKTACAEAVARNQVALQEALGRPVYEQEGRYWSKGLLLSRQRRAMAAAQSRPAPAAPTPTPTPVSKPAAPAPVTAPLSERTPLEAKDDPELKVKVREQLARWAEKGVDPSLIERGENPFDTVVGCKIDQLISEALLMKAKPTKRELRVTLAELQATRGDKPWTDASLQSNINIVTGAYKACGYDLLTE